MSKSVLAAFCALPFAFVLEARAETNVVLNHSGFLLSATDVPLDAAATLSFGLYDAESGGTLLWSGSCAAAVQRGYYSVALGGGCGPVISSTAVGASTRWLAVSVNAVTLAPRLALHPPSGAGDAQSLGGVAADGYARLQSGTTLAQTGSLHVSGSVTATAFSGGGAGLTGLSASSLTSGTLPDGRLAGSYGGTIAFTGNVTLPANTTLANGVVLGNPGGAGNTCTTAGAMRWNGAQFQGCNGSAWVTFSTVSANDGLTQATAGVSCKAIKTANAAATTGLYWVTLDGGTPLQVLCDMETDGGGWLVCARQSFEANGNYLGRTLLATTVGVPSIGTAAFGSNCATLMRRLRLGGSVEFGLKGSSTGEWQWVYPFRTENFYLDLNVGPDVTCDTSAPVTQCKGSATSGIVAISKNVACHQTGQHRTGDSYFIYQIADAQNSNVLLEIGQGDTNHPVGIRADCGTTGWWGSCGNPGGTNRAYAVPSQCGGTNRVQGVVTAMFRERD